MRRCLDNFFTYSRTVGWDVWNLLSEQIPSQVRPPTPMPNQPREMTIAYWAYVPQYRSVAYDKTVWENRRQRKLQLSTYPQSRSVFTY